MELAIECTQRSIMLLEERSKLWKAEYELREKQIEEEYERELMEIEEAYKKAAKEIQLHFNAKKKAIEKQYGEANVSKISPRSCAIDSKSFCRSGQQLYAATVLLNPETNSAHSKPSCDGVMF